MGAATYATMLAAARTLADERGATTDTFASPTEGLAFVNRAVELVRSEIISAGGHELFALEDDSDATVAGTSSYDLPDDHAYTLAIGLAWSTTDIEDVPAWEWSERDRLTRASWGNGLEKGYRLVGDQLVFLPVPTSAVTIVHTYLPDYTDATADTATFDGKAGPWRDAIEYNIASRLARMNGPEFSAYAREFERLCMTAIEAVREAVSNRAVRESPRVVNQFQGLPYGPVRWWPRVPA